MSRATVVEPAPTTPASRIDSLQALIRPRSVAVVGASRDAGTVGGAIFHNLLAHGFTGPVYPVNPNAPVVQSVAAYRTIEAAPGSRRAGAALLRCGRDSTWCTTATTARSR